MLAWIFVYFYSDFLQRINDCLDTNLLFNVLYIVFIMQDPHENHVYDSSFLLKYYFNNNNKKKLEHVKSM
jgi:uncharacterized membrane protein